MKRRGNIKVVIYPMDMKDMTESDIEETSCFVSDTSDKIILLLKLLKLHFHYLNNE